jgi:chondroitin AC lyase
LLKASNYRKAELENLLRIRTGEIQPNLTWNRFFWHSEYFTHQRPQWFSSVRMHSNRQNNMEEPHNEEGLKNHHFADGSNFITVTGKEYLDIFPVWDWQKIPGATIVQKPALPHWKQIAKKGLSEFVGGVSDGKYGAAAFDFNSPHDPLKARKSWFFFDREYVCLGTFISSDATYPVYTTLNQCLLNKEVVVKTNNAKTQLKNGKHDLKNVSWVLHDNIAYIFLSPTAINLINEQATGNWRQINHHTWATEEPVQKDVFTMWLDHGTKPQNANYAYIIAPGLDASSIDNYNKRSEVVILSNTPEIQAVQHKGLKRTTIVFYKAGTIQLSEGLTVTTENPCMVMFKTNGKTIENMVVSDPTRKLKSIQLTVNAPIEAKRTNWKSTWNKEKKASVIQIDLPATEELAGSSVALQLTSRA